MQLFKEAFGKMKDVDSSNKGLSLYYVVMVQTVTGESYMDSVELTVFNKRSSVKSADVTVYQDEKTMVAIRPESNVILVTKPEHETSRRLKFQGILQLQDSIFSKMELKSCVTESTGYRKLTFQLPIKLRSKLGINSVFYWIDESEVMVRKLQLVYEKREGQKLTSWEMEFIRFDPTYTGRPFDGSALSKVFDSRNTLRSIYRGYSVIDKR